MYYQQLYTQGKYFDNNPSWDIEDSPWKAKQILKIIQRNQLHLTSICEVGCGAGEILNQLYEQMPEHITFSGYEISPKAHELCHFRKKNRLNFYLADLVEDNNAFFDLLLCIDVVEHVEDYFSFLRKLKIKSQYKIFHIPLELSVSTILRSSSFLTAREKVGHIHSFTKETALAILKDTGYEIIDYFYTPGGTELPAKQLKTLLAKFPRKIIYRFNQDLAARLLAGYSLMVLTK